MLKSLGEDNDLKATAIQKNILWTYNKMLTNSIEPLIPSLSDRQQEILDESGDNTIKRRNCRSYDIKENSSQIQYYGK